MFGLHRKDGRAEGFFSRPLQGVQSANCARLVRTEAERRAIGWASGTTEGGSSVHDLSQLDGTTATRATRERRHDAKHVGVLAPPSRKFRT
jgi:hypothetical protein